MMDRLMPVAGMDPLPTTARHVSGNKNTKMISRIPAKIARNQKILRHPRYCARMPPVRQVRLAVAIIYHEYYIPIVGPNAGPKRIPEVAYPIYLPRSADVDISATTAMESAIAALHPKACNIRSKSSAR